MLNVYELIYMSRLGDENALATLLSYCMPVIYKEVNKAIELNSKLRMYYEDLIQESIVTFYYSIDRYREDQEAKFTTFLMIVLQRKMITLTRGYLHSHTVGLHDTLSLDEVYQDSPLYDYIESRNVLCNPVYNLHVQDCYDNVKKALKDLKPIEQEVFALWDLGLGYSEASKELGISYNAFDGHVQRIKKKLRKAVYEADAGL